MIVQKIYTAMRSGFGTTRRIHRISIAILCTILPMIHAEIPDGYYDSAQGLEGDTLRLALHNIIDNHQVQSYSSLFTLFETTDVKPDGTVWDMYSDIPGGTPPYVYNYDGSDQCGNYSGEGDCFNREHSWPQSWFNSNSPMKTDLFHVYPTDGYVNGQRGSFPYGEVGTAAWTSLNGSKRGTSASPGYSGVVFEPIDEYKGDLARTYFYMCTRYFTEDAGWDSNDMVDGADLLPWAVDLLLSWHSEDPVSEKELNRNDAVYQIQQNRNPFIDHPDWVYCIWGDGCQLMTGDLNQDTVVDVLDVVIMVDIILSGNPSNFQISVGDLNSDNSIDVLDIVILVFMILGAP